MRPNSPERTTSRIRRIPSVKRYERSTPRSRSAARAASTTARTSTAVRPNGFWQNTAAPRSSDRMDCSACMALGVAITTPSTPKSRRSSSVATSFASGASRPASATISRRRVGDGGDLDRAGIQNGLHAVAADPAHAQEAEARAGRCQGLRRRFGHDPCHHRVTRALRKPSGRSRVALSASSSRSRGKVCV